MSRFFRYFGMYADVRAYLASLLGPAPIIVAGPKQVTAFVGFHSVSLERFAGSAMDRALRFNPKYAGTIVIDGHAKIAHIAENLLHLGECLSANSVVSLRAEGCTEGFVAVGNKRGAAAYHGIFFHGGQEVRMSGCLKDVGLVKGYTSRQVRDVIMQEYLDAATESDS